MEKNLEHEIVKAFQEKDSRQAYPRKDRIWQQLETNLKKTKGTHIFWRIAAIVLGFFLIAGAFAAISIVNHQKNVNKLLQKENINLLQAIDSLQNITPEIITETKIIEKEVPVYIQTEIQHQKNMPEGGRILDLTLENNLLKTQIISEREELQTKIDSISRELLTLKTNVSKISEPEGKNKKTEIIELKSEVYDTLYQKKSKTENPKIKLQLFTNPGKKEQMQMNSNIFNK